MSFYSNIKVSLTNNFKRVMSDKTKNSMRGPLKETFDLGLYA